jgi:hypothetical protein
MCDIPADIAKDELDRRIAAFGAGHHGLSPTITLHGHRFRYVSADKDADVTEPQPAQPVLAEAAE